MRLTLHWGHGGSKRRTILVARLLAHSLTCAPCHWSFRILINRQCGFSTCRAKCYAMQEVEEASKIRPQREFRFRCQKEKAKRGLFLIRRDDGAGDDLMLTALGKYYYGRLLCIIVLCTWPCILPQGSNSFFLITSNEEINRGVLFGCEYVSS
jgi:hypothetical protein